MIIPIILFLISPEANSQHPVIEFTDKNFKDHLENKYLLVSFCEYWHKDCNALYLKYEETNLKMKDHIPKVIFGRIDCERAGVHTCKKYAIHSYPLLKLFKDGVQIKDYQGPFKVDNLVKFISTWVGTGAKHIKDSETHSSFLDETQFGLIGYFLEESPLKSHFLNVCDIHRIKHRCGLVTNKQIIHQNSSGNDLILFRAKHLNNPYEDDFIVYNSSLHPPHIPDFIRNHLHGLVGHRTLENRREFPEPLVRIYYKMDYIKDPKGTNYYRNRIFPVAKEYRDFFTFAVSDLGEHKKEIWEIFHLNIHPENLKTLVLAKDKYNQKYRMHTEFSTANLRNFVDSILYKSIDPHIKSQRIPNSDNKLVKDVVAQNFHEIVMENNQDTLILFYDTWDLKTGRLLQVYEQLAGLLQDENFVIVKIDAIENEVPEIFHLWEIPIVYWLPKGARSKPVRFRVTYRVDDVLRFISRVATDELKGFYRNGTKRYNPVKSNDTLLFNNTI